jgi:hypothetical protein
VKQDYPSGNNCILQLQHHVTSFYQAPPPRLLHPKRQRINVPGTMAAPSPAAIKARIKAHMNAEHADSIEDYLKFYNKITPSPNSAQLIDLDLDSMKIQYLDDQGSTQTSVVKIDPPMGSLGESRVRLVSMAEEATGKSFHQPPDGPPAVTPKKSVGWTRPEYIGLASLFAISFGFWALSREFPLSPGGPLEKIMPPIVVVTARQYREQLFALMIAIHAIEGSIMARKAWEEGLSIPLIVLWTVNGFFEGGPAIARFNKLARPN